MVNLDKYTMARIFRDGQTRLIIPNLNIVAVDAITNIVSSFVTNPRRSNRGAWFGNKFSNNDDSFLENSADVISRLVTGFKDILTIGLGVTKIETSQEYTMPFSKGIGSTGEVIHLLGARNEMINLQFTTDRYPGRMGHILRGILQKTLELAQVVYLIDDLFLVTPCLVKKTRLSKTANYKGAVMGELELVSLTTGGDYINEKFDSFKKIKNISKQLATAAKETVSGANAIFGTSFVVGVGAIAISATLINGIVSV